MTTNTFDFNAYRRGQDVFPEVTFEQFQECRDAKVRDSIVSKNRLLTTDTYNRTMNHIKGEDGQKKETFTLSFRKTGEKGYNIVYGVKKALREILELPITQHELDFAADAYEDQKRKGGVSCFDKAMWQKVIDENGGYLPLDIKAVDDGTLVKKGEPAMTITGPSELGAHLEPLLLQLYYQSAVAGDMHYLEEVIGEGRTVEFGYRSARSTLDHIGAVRSLYVGGGVKQTSNDAAATSIEKATSSGTIAHRYLAVRPSEMEAFERAIQKTEKIALLVDLVDSYRGIDNAISLKKKYRDSGKSIAMRLDSGNLADQARYGLEQIKQAGMIDDENHNKIVVADISSIEDVKQVEQTVEKAGFDPKKHILYGLGGMLVATNKTRDKLSGGYKVTNTEEGATGKLSDNPGKEPIPGIPNIEVVQKEDGTVERYVVQEDEPENGMRLLKRVYKDGEFYFTESDDDKALENAREQVNKSKKWITPGEVKLSEKTQILKQQVRDKLKAY